MSDIYLQITETPTVVTLSAPVVSGALAATVTVANVVSVNVVTMPAITVQAAAPSVTTVAGTVTIGSCVTHGVNVANSVTIGSCVTHGVNVANTVTIGSCVTHGVNVANSVTISSLPAISGTVTANTRNYGSAGDNWINIPSLDLAHPNLGTISFAGNYRWNGVNAWGPSVVAPNVDFTYITWLSDGNDYFLFRLLYVSDALDQTVVLAECQAPTLEFPLGGWYPAYPATLVGGSFTFTFKSKDIQQVSINSSDTIVPIYGTVTIGNSVTIGSLPVQLSTITIGGTARLNVTLSSATTIGATAPSYGNLYGGSDGTNLRAISVDTSGRTVVTGSVTVASTTVTVSALPSGALTTRFGSVTTGGTSQLTSCVTNTSRKYLLCQNIDTATVTIGIGFSPTTTQGIQLASGAGISFDAFCPTGAVWWLGGTGANFSILEG